MHVSNVANVEELHAVIIKYLRDLGIKYRLKKNGHANSSKQLLQSKHGAVFNRPLNQLVTEDAILYPHTTIEVPCFLLDACNSLRQNVGTEGIFRKGGSAARQKEIKAYLDKDEGNRLRMDHHEIDVANILKLFLRELPEPLLPSSFQEVLLRCLLQKDKTVESILHACLLLPLCNLNTLAYLMNFLSEVASHSALNKMDVRNLAIIISPSVMPLAEKMTTSSSVRLNNHVYVIELLIQNADQIGVLPASITEKTFTATSILLSNDELEKNDVDLSTRSKKKKGRRSGSLTRMFNGFKKMVGKGSSEELTAHRTPETTLSTPCIKSATKRKAAHPTGAFSIKKKRDVLKSLPQMLSLASTPLAADNPDLYHHTPNVCQHPNPRKSKSPATKSKHRRFFTPKPDKYDVVQEVEKKSRLSMRNRRSLKKQKRSDDTSTSDMSCHSEHLPVLERRWSSSFFGRKKRSSAGLQMMSPSVEVCSNDSNHVDSPSLQPFIREAGVNLSYDGINLSESGLADSSEDFVRIPKSEYEAIKNRVSAIENKISQEFSSISASPEESNANAELVQCAYEKTLVESTTFDNSSTDQLAKRLSRDLKIRRSVENKVIRSPSLRKIGTLRRRSRESGHSRNSSRNSTLARNRSWNLSGNNVNVSTENQFYPRPSLRRGRPNTVFTGLPQPSPMCAREDSRIHLTYQHDQSIKSKETSLGDVQNTTGGANTTNERDGYFLNVPQEMAYFGTGPVTRSQVRRASSFHGTEHSVGEPSRVNVFCEIKKSNSQGYISQPHFPAEQEWQDAQSFFMKETNEANIATTGRASIAQIRSRNAGMVMQRTKLFDCNVDGSERNVEGDYAKSKGINRTQSVLAISAIPKTTRVQQLRDSATKNLSQLNRKQSIGVGKVPVILPSSSLTTHPSLKSSPKKLGSPRKHHTIKSPYSAHKIKVKSLKPSPLAMEVKSSPNDPRRLGKQVSSTPCNITLPGRWHENGKENVISPSESERRPLWQAGPAATNISFSPQMNLPDNLKETIYDVCTPIMDKPMHNQMPASKSPLKDCNRTLPRTPRETPFIKQRLLTISPRHYVKTPQMMSVDRSGRRLVTPMKALMLTPLGSPRRQSPRLIMKSRMQLASSKTP